MVDKKLITYFEKFITPERKNRFDEVLSQRTNYITVVLEDVFQSHNISAVLRSCDCFGINQVHLIENKNVFQYNDLVGMGSLNWLNLIQHNSEPKNTLSTIRKLKNKGYRIIATSPHNNSQYLENIEIEKGPMAILFGTEYSGLTKKAFSECDEYLKIPLYGFTESLNISVSAAIILQHLYNRLVLSDVNWQLNEQEKLSNQLKWLKHTIKSADLIEKEFYLKK